MHSAGCSEEAEAEGAGGRPLGVAAAGFTTVTQGLVGLGDGLSGKEAAVSGLFGSGW